MDQYQKRKLFELNMDTTKEKVLKRIVENIEEFEDPEQFIASDEMRKTILQLCRRFQEQVEEKVLPGLTDNWLFYDIVVEMDGIELGIWCCKEIEFDGDGEIISLTAEREISVLKTQCKYLTIQEFAQKMNVKERTVNDWIRRGKIRSAVESDGGWKIPEITERPGRKYQDVFYSWKPDRFVDELKNSDLKGSRGIFLHQEKDNGIVGIVHWEKDRKKVNLSKQECERLEYQMIKNPSVQVINSEDPIIFTPTLRAAEENKFLEEMTRKLNKMEADQKEKTEKDSVLRYGPVVVRKGRYKGRIGDYDDDATSTKAIVYFGDMFTTTGYYEIPYGYLSSEITVSELVERISVLKQEISGFSLENRCPQEHIESLAECLLAERILTEKYHSAMWETPTKDLKLFVACNSKDLIFARCLVTDLRNAGYQVFLAEWSLKLGDNLLRSIDQELKKADVLIPVISQHFLASQSCMDEFDGFLTKKRSGENCKIMSVVIDNTKLDGIYGIYKYYQMDGFDGYAEYIRELLKSLSRC